MCHVFLTAQLGGCLEAAVAHDRRARRAGHVRLEQVADVASAVHIAVPCPKANTFAELGRMAMCVLLREAWQAWQT